MNSDLTPDLPHDPRLMLADEPLMSPTAHLEPKNGNGHAPAPRAADSSLKAELRAIVLDFVRRELA